VLYIYLTRVSRLQIMDSVIVDTLRQIQLFEEHSGLSLLSTKSTSMNNWEALKSVGFDAWQCDTHDMLRLLEEMYHQLGFVQSFNIQQETLKRFLIEVERHYRDNPFHNFRHCFCVAQMMYVLIHSCQLTQYFSNLELCSLITACICHDLDHPGLNNTYQINARTELARKYKNVSPLENHHAAVAFEILSRPECNIFSGMTSKETEAVHNDLSLLILATDMARHAEILQEFKERSIKFDSSSSKDLTSLKLILIKACDVSNELRPTDVSELWVERLMQEYFQQSELEKQNGLPFAPFMDPENVTKSKMQIGFIRFVLLPLFEAISKILPPIENLAVANLKKALNYYDCEDNSTKLGALSKRDPPEA